MTSMSAVNVKARVDNFLKSDQERQAFDLIFSYLRIKRKNWQWTQALEKVMIIFIDLCLMYDEQDALKIGLMNFKECMQNSYQDSLQIVLEKYVSTCEEMFEDSCSEIGNLKEFFEEFNTNSNANDFYLNSLNFEQGKSKELLKKTWRTLVNAYKQTLILLYKNKSLLKMYRKFGLRAFEKCASLNAIEDFKDLCKVLRNQIRFVIKQKNQKKVNFAVSDISANSELIGLRNKTIEISRGLGLMQESFALLEDVNELMRNRNKVPLTMMLSYYSHLAEVFYRGEFVLFHAMALIEYFSCLERINSDEDTLAKVANRMILAVLSVGKNSEELFISSELKDKYCVMFSMKSRMPSLDEVIETLANSKALQICSRSVREVYKLSTGKYDVYEFSDVIQTELEQIPEDCEQYKEGIKANCVGIVLKLLSEFFENVTFEDLRDFTSFEGFEQVKQEILQLEYNNDVEVYLNFEEELLEFSQNSLDKDNWLHIYDDFTCNLEQTVALAQSMREDPMISTQRKQLENRYVHFLQNLKDERELEFKAIKGQEARKVVLSRVVKKDNQIDEETQRRLDTQRKMQEARNQKEKEILDMKRVKIKQILKISPEMKILDIPLKGLKKHQLQQLDNDVFDSIQDNLKLEKEKRENEQLKKKYKVFDYSMRQFLVENWEDVANQIQESEIDLEDICNQNEKLAEKRQQMKEEFKKGQSFMINYQTRVMAERVENLVHEKIQFREDLNTQYKLSIYETAKIEIEKKIREKAKLEELMNDPRFRRNFIKGPNRQTATPFAARSGPKPGFPDRDSDVPVIKLERGTNFVPSANPNVPFGKIVMAKRGETFKSSGGTTSRFTNSSGQPRGQGILLRRTNETTVFSRPVENETVSLYLYV